MEKFLSQSRKRNFHSGTLNGFVTAEGELYIPDPKKLFAKRFVDLSISLLLVASIMWWLYPLIGILIRITSGGPVIFKQKRHGLYNKPFLCYKFRTMRKNGKADILQATKEDDRVTAIGRVLRKTSLDELPQILNVIRGDMSLIGPRPQAIPMNEVFSKKIDNYMFRHTIKPGITGLAQSRGYRGEIMGFYEINGRIKLDHFYIKNWSFLLDLKIIFWTLKSLLFNNSKAY